MSVASSMRERLKRRGRTQEILPHPSADQAQAEPPVYAGGRSGALRAAIFGANDGLVSNLSLIMGVAGAGVDRRFVLVAGIAGLLAGAFSMGAGEYVSMRVQRELFERLIHLEAHEIGSDPVAETEELAGIFERRGMPAALARRVSESLMEDPKTALNVHAREELGLDPEELGSPWGAALSSFGTFSVGAVLPLLPFLFAGEKSATVWSIVLSLGALFGIGATMTIFTGRRAWTSGARMLLIGGVAAMVTYGVGWLLGVTALG